MRELSYKPKGVCARRIHLAVDDGKVIKVEFENGCDGNSQAVSRLVEGLPVEKVIGLLKGIGCEGKATSCPDQLAQALEGIGKTDKD